MLSLLDKPVRKVFLCVTHIKGRNKIGASDEKTWVGSKALSGRCIWSVAFETKVHSWMFYQWVRKYKMFDYNSLVDKKKAERQMRNLSWKKDFKQLPLTESEKEELIRLRAQIEYIKAENAIIPWEKISIETMRAHMVICNNSADR